MSALHADLCRRADGTVILRRRADGKVVWGAPTHQPDDPAVAAARRIYAEAVRGNHGVFAIEPDPPDLAERQADRVAERQRAEAMAAGWTGDNWIACGCAAPRACPEATCINHRMAGIGYVRPERRKAPAEPLGATGNALAQLMDRESTAAMAHADAKEAALDTFGYGKPALTYNGRFLIYFNQHSDAPRVWCIAVPGQGWEIQVATIDIRVSVATRYEPPGPQPHGSSDPPVAWFEGEGFVQVDESGRAVITAAMSVPR